MKPGLAFCFIIYTTFAFPQKRSAEIAQLVSWHVGHFDSQLQSQENKSYFNIQLNAVQIWKHRKDGYWLYVEQAVSDQLNAPYRQRVYRIVHTDSAIIREEFIIPQALRYAGGYKFKRPLDELSRDSLLKRAGCEVDFKFDSGRFVGKTHLKTCPSEIRGVIYVMLEVEILLG